MQGLIRGWTKHLTPPVPGWQRTDPLDRGLVAEWRFDPVTGLTLPDYSGRGHHGTLTNGPTWVNRRYGPALYFNSANSEYVDVGDQNALDFGTGDFTIEIFARRVGAFGQYRVVVAKGRHLNAGEYLWYEYNIANKFRFRQVGLWYEWTVNDITQWTHLALARLNDQYQGYEDGVAITPAADTLSGAGVNFASNRHFTIACRTDHLNQDENWWLGDIAVVKVYRRALSAAEMRARYQICLKRAQPLTHVWMMPWGRSPVAPPVGGHMTLWGRYWGP